VLIVFLLLGIVIYVGLYLAWDFMAGRLQGPTAYLASLQRMMFVPDNFAFELLRGILLIVMLYVIGDLLLTAAKRGLKKKPPPDEMKLKQTTLPERGGK
jgi:hypothetical protein